MSFPILFKRNKGKTEIKCLFNYISSENSDCARGGQQFLK